MVTVKGKHLSLYRRVRMDQDGQSTRKFSEREKNTNMNPDTNQTANYWWQESRYLWEQLQDQTREVIIWS